jgi:hypothetical protein
MPAPFPAHISLLDLSTLNGKQQGVTNYEAVNYAMWRWIPWSKFTDLSRESATYILRVKVFSAICYKPLFSISSVCTFRWRALPYKLLNCWKMNKDFPSHQTPYKSWLESPALQNDMYDNYKAKKSLPHRLTEVTSLSMLCSKQAYLCNKTFILRAGLNPLPR